MNDLDWRDCLAILVRIGDTDLWTDLEDGFTFPPAQVGRSSRRLYWAVKACPSRTTTGSIQRVVSDVAIGATVLVACTLADALGVPQIAIATPNSSGVAI